jgi:FAD:protein FMN transferase
MLACEAMATRFELVLEGEAPVRLRAAGEAALRQVERFEAQLSFYRPSSEVRWINARAAREAVRVEPGLFGLLEECARLTTLTEGAFDITVGPLMRAWKFVGARGATPEASELAAARACVGMSRVRLDPDTRTVRFDRPGVEIDLGAAGKGYAVDSSIATLREHGVTSALLHGGTSSVHALGTQSTGTPWKVAWQPTSDAAEQALLIDLVDRGLAVSAGHGKAFVSQGRQYGHVIDPRTGQPVEGTVAAAVTGPSSFICDALSTALLVLGAGWLPELVRRFPGYSGWAVASPGAENTS